MGNVRNRVVLLCFLVVILFATYQWRDGRVLGVDGKKTEKEWSLMVGGDVMLGRSVNTRSIKYDDYHYPFLNIRDLLSVADLTMVNLENPVISGCKPKDTGMIFCSPPESLLGLVWSGVDVVNLDNNHSHNYGFDGYLETKKHLNSYGLGYFDGEDYWQVSIRGTSVGVLGFDLVSDSSESRKKRMMEAVKQKKDKNEVMIVNLHWGNEYQSHPANWMKEVARELISNGVDLIVGHHSHVVGEYEEIDGVPVIYSLGNLVFDQMWSEETRVGMLVKFDFEGSRIVGKTGYPIKIYDYAQPKEIENGEQKDRILKMFFK